MTTKKFLLILLAVILAALALPFFYHPSGLQKTGPGLPWEVETQSDGSTKVFGLILGKSTLADAGTLLGEQPQTAIIASPKQPGTLEAFFDTLNIGPITAKLFMNASLPPAQILEMQKRAVKEVPLATGAHRFDLAKADWQSTGSAPIASISLLPTASLDQTAVLARFGRPAERLKSADGAEHFLYPERGMDVALDDKGKVIIQYVLPARFAALREPLLAKSTP